MEAILKKMTPNCREEAKRYISEKEIPQLFEVSQVIKITVIKSKMCVLAALYVFGML